MKAYEHFNKTILLLLIFCLVGTFVIPTMSTAAETYKMKGKITAIDTKDNTVVVNVRMEKGKIYTVAGPLAPNAVLKKGKKSDVMLKDFNVGESVIVEWEVTSNGHIVKQLTGQ